MPNRRILLAMVIIVLSQLSSTLFAVELSPHTASYTAKIKKGISINGTAVRELRQLENGQWQYRFDVDSVPADIKESLIFDWQDGRVYPHRYHYQLSGFFIRDKERSISFDHQQKTASGRHKKKTWQIAIPENSLDRLGYQLQLLVDISSGRREVNYQIVHKGRVEASQFRVLKEETISTAIGEAASILVEKVRDAESKRKTLLWFAKDQPLLLLKMSQVEKDGEHYEIHLQGVDYTNPAKRSK